MQQWWVTQAGGAPVGPVNEDTLVRGIQAGKVPPDALVCEVGGARWRSLTEITQFARLLGRGPVPRRDELEEKTTVEPPTLMESGPLFWDTQDGADADTEQKEATDPSGVELRTERSLKPPTYPSDAPLIPEDEHTIVDVPPRPPSKQSR